ncbi:unnamed protein product [Amaranthus hypochondriacus]
MEGVYKELDESKTELEKLKEEYRIKRELSESLRSAHTEQLAKSEAAKLQIEKLTKELNDKSDELAELGHRYDEVKSKLQETESSLKQVSSVNEKIRFDASEKVQKLDEENRKLVSDLEEVTGRNDDLERKLYVCNTEIEGFKKLLSESQRKCLEAEEKVRAGRESKHREDVILKLEEESMSIQDQLKWKKEQFLHLEEAHARLQSMFQSSKKEWASEKSDMLEEMTMLQSKLDSQIRITESLESRLKMCNQALAHEESRRKALDVQLSESKQCFNNVLAEYEEAKAKIESLSNKRDEDIADLRNSLGIKEILLKEMEYKATRLEEDNKELLESLKELRESQINKRKVDPSVNKFRNKLKDVEQVHSKCSLALKEREAEWNSKLEKLLGEMKCNESDLKRKSEQLEQLKAQLDCCHSAMEVSGEETSILLLIMKSILSDAYAKLFKTEDQIKALKMYGREEKDNVHRLDMGDCATSEAQTFCIEQLREEIAVMTQKLDSMSLLEERSTLLESEVLQHKQMLKESSNCHIRLKEQISQMEVSIKNLSTALEKSNTELAMKTREATETQTELQIWKSKAESFRTCLEQSQEACQNLEKTVLEQVETEQVLRIEIRSYQSKMKEQEQKIEDLQHKTTSLDKNLLEKEAVTKAMKIELEAANKKEEYYLNTLKEKDSIVENLKKEIEAIEQAMKRESAAAESARREAQIKFQLETEELRRTITAQKDEQIRCSRELVSSLEQELLDLGLSSLSQGIENAIQIVVLKDALENYELCMKVEVESKNSAIDVLTEEVSNLNRRMQLQGESLLRSQRSVKELEALAESNKMDMEKLLKQSKEDRHKFNELMKRLEQENEVAIDNIKRLSFERDNLVVYLEAMSERFGGLCAEDIKLEQMLLQMLQNSDNDNLFASNASYHKDTKKEVLKTCDRSPLREINH